MPKIRTHYDNLQITRTASEAVVRAAYRGLSQQHHPDKNPKDREAAPRIMKVINEAYAVLSDPARRRQHDEWIDSQESEQHQNDNSPSAKAKQSATFYLRLRCWSMAYRHGSARLAVKDGRGGGRLESQWSTCKSLNALLELPLVFCLRSTLGQSYCLAR